MQERGRISEVLHERAKFLHEELVPYEGGLQKRDLLYHTRFHDFVAKKEEGEDERVSRKAAHKKIADAIWSELFEEDTTKTSESSELRLEHMDVQINILSDENGYAAQ